MSNEDLLPEDNEQTDYQERALRMLRLYKKLNKYSFCLWLNKFEYVADMIEIPNDKLVEIFNKLVDNNIQELVKQNNPFVNFSELSYEEIINHYFSYFNPRDVKYIYRIRFIQRNQYEQELIEKYANSLHRIYIKCKYRDVREKKLCEKFINGLYDDNVKTHVKKHSILPFDETVQKVLEIAEFQVEINRKSQIHPTINIYSPGNGSIFYVWLNKFEYVADVLHISDHRMVEYFNSMVDDNAHTAVKKANPSINFSELTYDEIIKYYLEYFDSADETDLHRKRFLCRKQYEQEAIQNYAVRLRKIYIKCHYNDYLEEKLSQQFIHGIRNSLIKSHFNILTCVLFVDLVSMAIEFKNVNDRNTHKNQNLLMIDTYSLGNEGMFCEWLNKFEYTVHIAKVETSSILQIFNETVDNDVHIEIKEANPSTNFSELSYDEIIYYYLKYFASADETDLHRRRFLCRNQYDMETIEEYIYNLRKIYSKCSYSNDPQNIICKRFLDGIYDIEIKTILKKFSGFSFNEIVRFAIELTKFKQQASQLNLDLSRIPTFHPEMGEEFYVWLNKFEYIADIIIVPNDEINKFFNHMVDDDVHTYVKKNNPSIDFSELSYDELIDYYLEYFSSIDETDLHRRRFLCRNQYEKETIERYADNLLKIYSKCNDTDPSDEIVRERFREGLLDDDIRNYLCKFRGLSFDVSVAMAVSFLSDKIQVY